MLIPPVSRGPRTSGVLVFRQLKLVRRLFVACLKQGAGAQTPGATPAQTLLQTRQQQICGCGSFAKLRCYVHGVIAHADAARCLISPAPRTPPKYLLHNLGVALTNAKQHMARDAPHPPTFPAHLFWVATNCRREKAFPCALRYGPAKALEQYAISVRLPPSIRRQCHLPAAIHHMGERGGREERRPRGCFAATPDLLRANREDVTGA